MEFSEKQIQDLLELKDRLTEKIHGHEEEIEFLKKNIEFLDTVLKQSSFTKASALGFKPKKTENAIPITGGPDGGIIANAFVTPEQVSIVLNEDVNINPDTPPFKSFFLERIIGEMKLKDSTEADVGRIQKESIIDYVLNKNGSNLREIIIKNYRQNERIKEIINTVGWSFTRMLENQNK